MGIFDPGIFDSGIFDTPFAGGSGSFTADAILKKSTSSSFTANAILLKTTTSTLTADAVFRAAITANAVLKKTISSSKTANAVLKRTDQSGSFTADSVLVSFTGSFAANAVLFKTISSTKTADAVIKRTAQTGSFTADAVFISFHGTYTANAAIRKLGITKAFTADAVLQAFSFTASAYIITIPPGEPGGPPAGTKIPAIIRYNGTDITDDVMIKGASFTQAVNARPGDFRFDVKDDDHIYNFVSGGHITLDIDNRRAFDGHIFKATARYAFDVDIVTDPSETPRIWHLEGPDLNILFGKRVVYNQVNPNADLPIYPAGTTDVTVIRDLMRNYLDLSGDDITYDDIAHVGSPNPDHDGLICQVGSTWGTAMAAVGQLPGAVWGLTQDRALFYEDDSTEDAPFRLSDTPNGTTTIGYSNFNWINDGTKLVNDAQVWGAGTGSTTVVYSEETDATSIADHGRWQLPGQFRSDMYKQASVDNVSHSIVYGSPQNLHGGKDDHVVITCRVVKHGLRAGHKVHFASNVHGISKVVPIRRLTITFVNVYDVLYDLELTQEIDEPWYFAEFAWPTLPPFHFPKYKPPIWHWHWDPPPQDCDCPECPYETVDDFTRTVAPRAWDRTSVPGPNDSWGQWTFTGWTGTSTSSASVNGTQGILVSGHEPGGLGDGISVSLSGTYPGGTYPWADGNFSARITFQLDDNGTGSPGIEFRFGNSNQIIMTFQHGTGTKFAQIHRSGFTGFPQQVLGGIETGVDYIFEMIYDQSIGLHKGRLYLASEPVPDWTMSRNSFSDSSTVSTTPTSMAIIVSPATDSPDTTYSIDLIEASDTACPDICNAVQFDDFNRTVTITPSSGTQPSTLGAGIATPSGYQWLTQGWNSQNHIAVNGSQLVFSWVSTTTLSGLAYVTGDANAPWPKPAWTMTSIFTAFRPSGAADAIFKYRVESYAVLTFTMGIDDSIETSGVGVEEPFSWVGGTMYNVKWEVTWDGPERVKVWPVGTTEPGSWLSETTNNGSGVPPTNVTFQVDLSGSLASSSTSQLSLNLIDFDYDGKPCYFGGPGPLPGGLVSAPYPGSYGCETAVRVSDTVYSTSYTYLAGTIRVNLNGRLMRPTYDYTEQPSSQTVTFLLPVDSADVVYVCYFAGYFLAVD